MESFPAIIRVTMMLLPRDAFPARPSPSTARTPPAPNALTSGMPPDASPATPTSRHLQPTIAAPSMPLPSLTTGSGSMGETQLMALKITMGVAVAIILTIRLMEQRMRRLKEGQVPMVGQSLLV